ncbi:VOC family protein [Sphingomonas sp. RB56-2]|uniref:VOC family protein n=1 Tax=Sphingomonas brevis TaxID=2908206 RepID=A0ABT0SA03_9SPHN|nr:VOC family protein [Sphingomonas brevis]MCL6740901.1 VOC family protein [Sphingomonas brevis]
MKLALTALLVRDYEEAIAFYCDALGFRLVEDSDQGGGRRWVVVSGDDGGALLLAKANKAEELAAVGNQFGGRVGLFASTDDFAAVQARLINAGALFEERPRREPYGTVAVFRDLYGNRWDLIEPTDRGAS